MSARGTKHPPIAPHADEPYRVHAPSLQGYLVSPLCLPTGTYRHIAVALIDHPVDDTAARQAFFLARTFHSPIRIVPPAPLHRWQRMPWRRAPMTGTTTPPASTPHTHAPGGWLERLRQAQIPGALAPQRSTAQERTQDFEGIDLVVVGRPARYAPRQHPSQWMNRLRHPGRFSILTVPEGHADTAFPQHVTLALIAGADLTALINHTLPLLRMAMQVTLLLLVPPSTALNTGRTHVQALMDYLDEIGIPADWMLQRCPRPYQSRAIIACALQRDTGLIAVGGLPAPSWRNVLHQDGVSTLLAHANVPLLLAPCTADGKAR